jgi:hypothetical protein
MGEAGIAETPRVRAIVEMKTVLKNILKGLMIVVGDRYGLVWFGGLDVG